MIYNSLDYFYNLPLLYKFYKRRKENLFIGNVPWWEGISEDSVGNFVVTLTTYDNKIANFVLIDVESSYGKVCKGLQFSLINVVGSKPIKDCNFREFVESYGDFVIQYIKGKELITYAK